MENNSTLQIVVDFADVKLTTALSNFFAELSGININRGEAAKTEIEEASRETIKAPKAKSKVEPKKEVEEASEEAKEAPAAEVDSMKEEPKAATKASTIKVEDIRAELQKKVTNNREAIKEKLTSLNAKNVTVLATDKYEEFMEFLTALD